MAEKAQENYDKMKDDLYEENHTTRAHNMERFSRDTEHDWEYTETVPGFVDGMLVVEGGSRPWFAKKFNYLLTATIGMSWYTRMQFMDNTAHSNFHIVKTVEE